MKRGGQVTIFIAIGLLVFLVIALLIAKISSLNRTTVEDQGSVDSSKVIPVQNYVEMCMNQVGTEALDVLGKQGRIYPKTWMEADNGLISYFYYKGNSYFPQKVSFLEEDVSRYVRENIKGCLNGLSSFDYGITARDSQMQVLTDFNDRDVSIYMNYPVTVDFRTSKKTLSKFSTKISMRFLPIYELSREIYEKTESDPEWIDSSFLASQPYNIRLVRFSENILVYEITDSAGLENRPFTYRFAVKYNF